MLSLTRDRIRYTRDCFRSLRENAGCEFDHYVLDQKSTDGGRHWLIDGMREGLIERLILSPRNVGIRVGMNVLLEAALVESGKRYDVVVKFDNDCEVVERGTLAAVCSTVVEAEPSLLSPRVEGLKQPPVPSWFVDVAGERIGVMPMIGGIFSACSASVFDSFRYDETGPIYGGDDDELAAHVRSLGGTVGYLIDWHVNHYRTTVGQHEDYPEYFERTLAEGKPAI